MCGDGVAAMASLRWRRCDGVARHAVDAAREELGTPRRRRRGLTRVHASREGAVPGHLSRAGMGKIPNYFKSAQKELLSLGGKLIDKMKDYDKDNIPTKIIDKIGADSV